MYSSIRLHGTMQNKLTLGLMFGSPPTLKHKKNTQLTIRLGTGVEQLIKQRAYHYPTHTGVIYTTTPLILGLFTPLPHSNWGYLHHSGFQPFNFPFQLLSQLIRTPITHTHITHSIYNYRTVYCSGLHTH